VKVRGYLCGLENHDAPDEMNPTYGTARVVLGLRELSARHVSLPARMLAKARQWLVDAQNRGRELGRVSKRFAIS
jgi:hypothetical protein